MNRRSCLGSQSGEGIGRLTHRDRIGIKWSDAESRNGQASSGFDILDLRDDVWHQLTRSEEILDLIVNLARGSRQDERCPVEIAGKPRVLLRHMWGSHKDDWNLAYKMIRVLALYFTADTHVGEDNIEALLTELTEKPPALAGGVVTALVHATKV